MACFIAVSYIDYSHCLGKTGGNFIICFLARKRPHRTAWPLLRSKQAILLFDITFRCVLPINACLCLDTAIKSVLNRPQFTHRVSQRNEISMAGSSRDHHILLSGSIFKRG